MHVRTAIVVAFASGCNFIYELEPTQLRDESDIDEDGVLDVEDNCVTTPNPPPPGQTVQIDTDLDTIGDACDNCALLSNVEQRAVGDGDELGDLCDPHPTSGSDCLVVLDTFADPARLFEHWQVVGGDRASVVAEVGRLSLRPRTGENLALAAIGADGMLLGDDHDLLVRGKIPQAPDGAIFHVVTDAALPSFGFGCGLRFVTVPNIEVSVAAIGGPSTGNTAELTPPVDDDFVIRLASRSVESPFAKVCRVEYGVSVGIQSFGGQQPKGWTGVRTVGAAVEITGIALTKHVASGTCPPAQRW